MVLYVLVLSWLVLYILKTVSRYRISENTLRIESGCYTCPVTLILNRKCKYCKDGLIDDANISSFFVKYSRLSTLNPVFKGEGTKILFQSTKSLQINHFGLRSCWPYFLFVGGPPANNFLFAGGLLENNFLFAGGPLVNNYFFAGGPPAKKFLFAGVVIEAW